MLSVMSASPFEVDIDMLAHDSRAGRTTPIHRNSNRLPSRFSRWIASDLYREGKDFWSARNPHEIRWIGLLMLRHFSFDWYRKVGRVTTWRSLISVGLISGGQVIRYTLHPASNASGIDRGF